MSCVCPHVYLGTHVHFVLLFLAVPAMSLALWPLSLIFIYV